MTASEKILSGSLEEADRQAGEILQEAAGAKESGADHYHGAFRRGTVETGRGACLQA